MLGFIQNKLAIAYRTRLTEAAMDQYLGKDAKDEAKVFYKMCAYCSVDQPFLRLSRN